MQAALQQLQQQLTGALYFDGSAHHQAQLRAYATDASVYEEMPLAVAIPATVEDLQYLVAFATANQQTLIPRAAGTSLAGQVVGNGIVVDIGQRFNQVLELDATAGWVKVQPGMIRDDLNHYLQPYGWMFGPETSTANRAMLGGMLGNNSCGLHSIVWGSVREHLLEATVILHDGSIVVINQSTSLPTVDSGNALFEQIKASLWAMLQDADNQQTIRSNTPHRNVRRRNTGYAVDALLDQQPYLQGGTPYNICSLLAGSEGTLAMVLDMKLQLLPLPPAHTALICVHCNSLTDALLANAIAIQHHPMASELVDKTIMDFTIAHPLHARNRFFLQGDPAALLMVEFMANSKELLEEQAAALIASLQAAHHGYAYPILWDDEGKAAWEIRKAGLGLLRNAAGKLQPVNLIEDCAVAPEHLPAYIADVQAMLRRHHVNAAYYAHAGAGELHIEPMLDLKSAEGLRLFRQILEDTVQLLRRYNGSLSGEHGDGRLRGEFIRAVAGEELMQLFVAVKQLFDPHHVFNAGKIVQAPPMDTQLRMQQHVAVQPIATHFSFKREGSMLQLAEKCSGSGDCRRSAVASGLMCPSYMATRNELDTTRARANLLRQFLSDPQDKAPLSNGAILEAMDLCLSCKGCKVECPSGVDVAKMKAEFLQQYYTHHPVPFRSRLIANFSAQMKLAAAVPAVYNAVMGTPFMRKVINRVIGFHPDRTMPLLHRQTLRQWYRQHSLATAASKGKLYLFCDEFTNYTDTAIGIQAIQLLEKLGYEVLLTAHAESGRTWLSKGFVQKAKSIAIANINALSPLIDDTTPLVGIEPSAILTIRDEYLDLAPDDLSAAAKKLATHTFTIEEFLYREMQVGKVVVSQFTNASRQVLVHTHCYQKVLSSSLYTQYMLGFPENYSVQTIAAGCCGMAGSFGYEREHYPVAQQIGNLQLFPALRTKAADTIIAAAGTSCRHQIKDGVGLEALHPVTILWQALL